MTGDTIKDYITGMERPVVGAELNRQAVEQLLVDTKKYSREEILVDVPIRMTIDGEPYQSRIDLVVTVAGTRWMAVKCAAGSLDSWQKEIVSAARLLETYQIPVAVASDGHTALIWDTVSGKPMGQGLDAIPSRSQAEMLLNTTALIPLPEKRRIREMLIFRSYSSMNVNIAT